MRTATWLVIGLLAVMLSGCGGNDDATSSGEGTSGDGHSHAGHNHGHGSVGPHGGHIVELNDATYHLEWTHDNKAHKVTLYVLDNSAAADAPIPYEKLTIDSDVDGKGVESFELMAVDATDGSASKFEAVDASLVTYLLMTDGVINNIKFEVDGKEYSGQIKHEHHGHAH